MKMMGNLEHGQCPYCRHGYEPGPDCPDDSKTRGQRRAQERRQWRADGATTEAEETA